MSAPTAIPHLMTPSDTAAFATANTPKADSNSTPQVANNAKRPVMSLLEFIAVYPSRSTNSGGPCIRCNCVRNFRDGVKVACLHRDTPVTSLYAVCAHRALFMAWHIILCFIIFIARLMYISYTPMM
jgi:hypothetical protein